MFLLVAVLNSDAHVRKVLEGFTAIDVGGATRGEKGVQESLPFAYDSVETENKDKEVLECQLVTTC